MESPRSRRLAGIVLALSMPSLVFVSTRKILGVVPCRLRWMIGTALIFTRSRCAASRRPPAASSTRCDERRLEEARTRVGHFVGRDTEDLSESEVCRAAVESVAENTSDGVVAPMLYGLLFGAPGALAYKAVNTLDSMVGHRNLPTRSSDGPLPGWTTSPTWRRPGLTMLAVAAISGRPLRTLRIADRYGPLTTSPNAGMAEAAFAGALGVRLGGTNTYGGVLRKGPTLGEGRLPESGDIRRAVQPHAPLLRVARHSGPAESGPVVVRGWAEHPGDRHHGAHGEVVSQVSRRPCRGSARLQPEHKSPRRATGSAGSRPEGPLRGVRPLPRPGVHGAARGPRTSTSAFLPENGRPDQRRGRGAVPRRRGGRSGRKGAGPRAHLLRVRGGGASLRHGGRPQGGQAAGGRLRFGPTPRSRTSKGSPWCFSATRTIPRATRSATGRFSRWRTA